jgi:hypothetical protein
MADFTLANGDEITFDLNQITVEDWEKVKNPAFSQKGEFETIGRITGLDPAEIKKMKMGEYKMLFKALVLKIANPLSDPN